MTWQLIFFGLVLPAGIAYSIGRGRDRGGLGLLLGLLLSWIGVVLALFLPSGGLKCPACAERIKPDATICKHCHTPLVMDVVAPWQKDRYSVAKPAAKQMRKVPRPRPDRDTV